MVLATMVSRCALVLVALLGAQALPTAPKPPAHAQPAHPPMRPETAEQLTPKTFDAWIHAAVDNKKTAFVRWMSRDDAAKNCTWITRGYYSPTHGMDDKELAEHHKNNGMEHGSVEDPTKDPCKMVHEQAKAWNALTLKHKDNDKMVFGDVVVSDWPQAVNESHHL
jgi:hypothetical protein